MRRHHRDLQILSEMNLTNLIDTAFTLLIAFMLVAPMIKHGIDIDLPKVSAKNIQTETKALTIVIDEAPTPGMSEPIYIEDRRVELEEIPAIIEDWQTRYAQVNVVIEADRASTYNTFAEVMGVLKRIGIDNVGLITQPEEARTARLEPES